MVHSGCLLTTTGPGTPFVFKEPLGQAREVKVALSGLFGRFVARAYLERYFSLSIFVHLGSRSLLLDSRRLTSVNGPTPYPLEMVSLARWAGVGTPTTMRRPRV
jgi:hypothetical protein